MKMQSFKKRELVRQDIGSPASVSRFRELASAFTKEATRSKEAAIKVLKSEGILTAKGNLTKHYSAK